MKSNLDKQFKTDETLEKNGIWFQVDEGVKFLLRRFGGSNNEFKKSMAKHYKPHARRIEKGLMSLVQEQNILTKVLVESCLLDWEGVEVDGKEVDYSPEAAYNVLKGLPELTSLLIEHSSDSNSYAEQVEELGNS